MKAAAARRRNEHNERAWAVWHVAALQRAKKLPPLEQLYAKEKPRRQTWQEQLKIAEMWQAVMENRK